MATTPEPAGRHPSRHLSVHIDRPVEAVYAYARQPLNLPEWAPGLGSGVREVDGAWFVITSEGEVGISFAPENAFGVLDHEVVLPSGERIHNPVRVVPDGDGSEVVFTLRRQPGMTDEDVDRDAGLVAADLRRLKVILESATG